MSTDSGEHSSSGEQQPQRSRPLTFNMFDPGFNYSPSSTITGSGDSVLSPSENRLHNGMPTDRSRSPLRNTSQLSRRTSSSPSYEDLSKVCAENRQMKSQIKQMQNDIQSEQDIVAQLRRKLTSVEKARLDATSKNNEEVADLQSQVARLRSQVEKGEAMRQNLEFELAKCRREVSNEKRSAEEKESVMGEMNENMKEKINALNRQLEELGDQLKAYKETSQAEEMRLRNVVNEKEKIIASCHTEQDILEAEKDKLNNLLLEHEGTIADLNEKIEELQDERRAQAENLRRQVVDMDYTKEREERLKRDYETALQRIKSLEDSIEAERAAHLESKFNSEIIQLRVRDLEGALDTEKSAKGETQLTAEKFQRQLGELEHAYQEERKMSKHTREKLEKLEKDHANVKKQLTDEVNDKKSIISNLSKQLEIHQKNFEELKEELAKAKKRQIYLEETYGGSMRELELLIQNFQVDESKKKKDKKDRGKPVSPSVVLETLRHTLMEYKKKLDATQEELSRMKSLTDHLTTEGESYKDMMWAKDKALEETQQSLGVSNKELQHVRAELSDLEGQLATMKVDLQTMTHKYEKEKNKSRDSSDEITKLAKKYKTEEDDKFQSMHMLYQRLVAGQVVASHKGKGFDKFTWSDLTTLVQEQTSALMNNLQRSEEKLKHLEGVIRSKDEAMDQMQHAHEVQVDKLEATLHEQEAAWQTQKQDMEEHYSKLLGEVHQRSKKTQAMADQAWEKIRLTGNVQQGLEAECAELREMVLQKQHEQSGLLAGCALLAGAFFPLMARVKELSSQRNLLDSVSRNCDGFKDQARVLVETLSAELGEDDELNVTELGSRKRNPLLKFRVGAIAVMAANRLNYLGLNSHKMFVSYDPIGHGTSAAVYSGGIDSTSAAFTGVGLGHYGRGVYSPRTEQVAEEKALSWVTNQDLCNTVVSCMSDIQSALKHTQEDKPSFEPRLLINAAKNSFHKMVDKLYSQFEAPVRSNSARYGKGILIQHLGQGLRKVLLKVPVIDKRHMLAAQDVMSSLQQHILDFTTRLHQAEVDRRNLKLELNHARQENSGLKHNQSRAKMIEDELIQVKEQNQHMIPLEKFNSVCQELDSALKREQQAQGLLNEQSQQLQGLSRQLDVYASDGAEKDHTLSQAVQGLSEAKLDLRRKDQALRQLESELSQLEDEKKSMRNNIYDAENTLRTAAKDREVLTKYLRGVQAAFEKSKQEVLLARGFGGRDFTLSKVLMSSDLLPPDVGKHGPEVIACQNVVGAFVDAQHQAFSKILALEDEIESHKRHIATLKKELSAACQREYDDQANFPHSNRSGRPLCEDRSYSKDEFLPLQEDTEPSVLHSVSPKSRSYRSQTDSIRSRSPTYRTPNRITGRPGNLRPRSNDSGFR